MNIGSGVRIRLFHILHFVRDLSFPLLKILSLALMIGVTAYELPTRDAARYQATDRPHGRRHVRHQKPKAFSRSERTNEITLWKTNEITSRMYSYRTFS